MAEVLIYGDTVRSPELRHEIPLGIMDPFVYAEKDGKRFVMVSMLEAARVEEAGDYEVIRPEELGVDDLLAQGLPREEITLEMALRATKRFGISDAIVPRDFPLEIADFLRANGVKLTPDRGFFVGRRRAKNEAELEGIRRAQKAAEAGMGAVRELLRRADDGNGGGLTVDGKPLTSEWLKQALAEAFVAHGCTADDSIASHGAQAAIGHDTGSGQIKAGETVVVDLWPRDGESACFADMTRTFVVGESPDEVKDWHRLCKQALDEAIEKIRPGVKGVDVFRGTCELFQQHGYPTPLTKQPGTVLEEGFYHGLGHGVGLEVHEEPNLGITGEEELVVGDVITIEPGLYRPGYGGCRLEDLLVVTEDGAENLTDFPYDLEP